MADLKCRTCGETFDEPKRYTDWVEAWGHMEPMNSYECPYCGSSDYDDRYRVEREEEEALEEEEDNYDFDLLDE